MARFDDFTRRELSVVNEALEWSQPEFYNPGHTKADRAVLHQLIEEVKTTIGNRDLPWYDDDIVESVPDAAERAQEEPKGQPVKFQPRPSYPTAKQLHGPQEHQAVKMPTPQHAGRPVQYSGFLYIRCSKCGEARAFNARVPITTYRCGKCDGFTPLTNMSPMRITCECGAKWFYTTNITDPQTDIACLRCGSPVAMEYVSEEGQYCTINARENRRKFGRGKRGGRR